MPVKGTYLAIAGSGIVLLWSGLRGKNWSDVIRSVIAGQKPGAVTTAYQITGTPASAFAYGSGSGGASNPLGSGPVNGSGPIARGTYQVFARALLASYGWQNQWSALNSIEMAEAGWNAHARNPSSGAFGIAQALGHGTSATAGSEANEYGNYGVSVAVCKGANSGNGYDQLRWMFAYIKSAYGDPNAAWAYHQAHNAY